MQSKLIYQCILICLIIFGAHNQINGQCGCGCDCCGGSSAACPAGLITGGLGLGLGAGAGLGLGNVIPGLGLGQTIPGVNVPGNPFIGRKKRQSQTTDCVNCRNNSTRPGALERFKKEHDMKADIDGPSQIVHEVNGLLLNVTEVPRFRRQPTEGHKFHFGDDPTPHLMGWPLPMRSPPKNSAPITTTTVNPPSKSSEEVKKKKKNQRNSKKSRKAKSKSSRKTRLANIIDESIQKVIQLKKASVKNKRHFKPNYFQRSPVN